MHIHRRNVSRLRRPLLAAGVGICLISSQAAAVEFVAHRGGYIFSPENTCAAFRACSGLVDRIEFDVRTTADGELVLMHDDTVTRTTTGYGAVTAVANLTLAQLKELDAGIKFSPLFAGERIPTFAEALRALPAGVPPMVHRKTGSASNVVAGLRAENACSNAIVACEDYDFLRAVRQLEPGIGLAYIGSGTLPASLLDDFKTNGIGAISWDKSTITTGLVEQVHVAGMRFFIWSLGTSEIETYLDLGVDGLVVDDPLDAHNWVPLPPPSNEQLAQGLVAYWKLDDGLAKPAALVAQDVELNSPGRLAGFGTPATWISGAEARLGGALRLDGINDRVDVPTNAALDIGTNAVSISLWVKLTTLPSGLSADYAGIYDSTDDAYSIYLDRVQKELRFKVTDVALDAARPGIPEAQLRTGVWHHVVGVYHGSAGTAIGQALIYLDGRIVDIHSGTDWGDHAGYGLTNAVRPRAAAAIGRNGTDPRYYFAGDVDDVAVWRRALTSADVRQIHSAGTNGIPLEQKVMSIWISDVYSVPDSANIQVEVQVEHAALEDHDLRILGADDLRQPFTAETPVAQIRRTRSAGFSLPATAATNGPRFLRAACP